MKVYELFDYVCGTSTGALLSGLLFVKKSTLAETERTYRELSMEIFKMNNLLGISQLFLNHAFYDCKLLEKIVRYESISVWIILLAEVSNYDVM